jgi:hypothetical protein
MKSNNSSKLMKDNSMSTNIQIPPLKKISFVELSVPFLPRIHSISSRNDHSIIRKKLIARTRNILKINHSYKSSLFNISKASNKKLMRNNSVRNLKLKSLFLRPKFNYSLSDIILTKNNNSVYQFHQKLMLQNKFSFEQYVNDENFKKSMEKNSESEQSIHNILYGEKEKKKRKTGIFGPEDSIVSVIRAKMERLKYDQEYKNVDPEIKELIKDEILDAQVKLKMKPEEMKKKNGKDETFVIKKLKRFGYLKKRSSFRGINSLSNVPFILKDGYIMTKLVNQAFDLFHFNNPNRK